MMNTEVKWPVSLNLINTQQETRNDLCPIKAKHKNPKIRKTMVSKQQNHLNNRIISQPYQLMVNKKEILAFQRF